MMATVTTPTIWSNPLSIPLISVVSGTFNRLSLLQQMVESARAELMTMPHEFVIVDGGSSDGSIAWCNAQPDVRLIEQGELLGAITAFTDGAKAAKGKYVLLANDDVQFKQHSILAALAHLENNPNCGAVAFKDNRAKGGGYDVYRIPARREDGSRTSVPYAQVGLFRRWLGDALNWWRGHDPRFATARTYGGDNLLSANIWQAGYSVDTIEQAVVHDHFPMTDGDELRRTNGPQGEADSQMYYSIFPATWGPVIASKPIMENPDEPQLRILYLPIYEPGYAVQKAQKHGLRDALRQWGNVYEFDYMGAGRNAQTELEALVYAFKPHLMVSQFQSVAPINAEALMRIRACEPHMVVVNWNGDYSPGGLVAPDMLHLLRFVDLQLTINASVLPEYEKHNIPAAYWQIGYEEPGDDLPTMPAHDVVWLASIYNEARRQVKETLEALPGVNVGIYEPSSGTLYDFAKGKALYRNAKIAIGTNEFPDGYGFVSNRFFQALAAGNCLLLHQHVPGLEELTGIKPGVHFIEWHTLDELQSLIRYWLDPENEQKRVKITKVGTKLARKEHTFEARVKQLFTDLLPLAKRRPRISLEIIYTGPRQDQFGLMGKVSRRHYIYQPGQPLLIDSLDWPLIEREMPGLWKEV